MKKLFLALLLVIGCVDYVPGDIMSGGAKSPAHFGSINPIQFAGDLSGNYATQNVVGWRGKALDAVSMAAPSDAQLPVYVNGSSAWKSVSMSGDVTISNTGVATVASGIKGITQLTGQVTAGPGSGSQVGTVTPGTAGQIAVTNTSPSFAWTSLINYETTHGRFFSGGSGSDYKVALGPLSGAETTDSTLHLLANGESPSNSNWIVDYGAACQAVALHNGSVCFNARGAGGAYGDVTFTNANGNPGTIERLGYFDGLSGALVPLFGINFLTNGNITAGTVLTISGGLRFTTLTTTTNRTVDTSTYDNVIVVDTSSGAVTVTLPPPLNGRWLQIIDKKSTFCTNNLTLARNASEKINNVAASKTLSSCGYRGTIWSDGTDWYL